MMKVLSTKTLDSDTLAYAQTLNIEVVCVDFIAITAVPFDIKNIDQKKFDTVVFTSANAVKYFFESNDAAGLVKDKTVFGLQGKTGEGLLAAGVKANVIGNNASELADSIIEGKSSTAVLHVCGNLKLPVLENKLKVAGIGYTDLMVYKTIRYNDKRVNELFDAVLFYSPSGVDAFLAQNDLGYKTICCCIGHTTTEALRAKKNTANIITAQQPSPIAMLTAVADYWKRN
jgi:uroporphyrinogen-III synthase